MPVRIISIRAIHRYIERNPNAGPALVAWAAIVESQEWKKPQDIVDTFGAKAVDILGKKDKKVETVPPERAVIDIKGNHLRVIVKYQFHPELKVSCIYIKWIGTHAEYDKVWTKNQQYDIEQF